MLCDLGDVSCYCGCVDVLGFYLVVGWGDMFLIGFDVEWLFVVLVGFIFLGGIEGGWMGGGGGGGGWGGSGVMDGGVRVEGVMGDVY